MKIDNLFKFELSFNGKSILPEEAAFLYQSDPYPGGLTYRCTISGRYIRKYFDYVSIGMTENLSDRESREFFQSCDLIWPTSESIRLEVFLNSVESIDNA